jgi:hypothetical protein
MKIDKIEGIKAYGFDESIEKANIIKQDDLMDEKYDGLTK